MAPTGSSTPALSKKKTLKTTITPAMAPMMHGAQLFDEGTGAVMATRPANMPLHIIDGSGFMP